MIREWVKARPRWKRAALALWRTLDPILPDHGLRVLPLYIRFLCDWRRYRRQGGYARALDLYPCLFDRTRKSAIDAHYFYQSIWAFRHIYGRRPSRHVDVGS